MLSEISVSPAPHIGKGRSTQNLMLDVIIALAPAMALSLYYFRMHSLLVLAVCVVAAVATEWVCNAVRKKPSTLADLSAVVTAIILALSVPPALPWWAAALGSIFAIGIGKMVFGGLGANIFNPAMAGRAFLTASFGILMTTWTVPASIDPNMPAISPANTVNALTQATPLAWSKTAIKSKAGAQEYNRQQFRATVTGEVGGCVGETGAIALLIGGAYLLIRRTIDIHIPLAVLSAAFVAGGIAYLVNSSAYVQPFFHLTSGGLLLGAFFIATDPVTAPLTAKGKWIFGAVVGGMTLLVRIVGEYPEGVMYAVLLGNSVRPLIDRLCNPTPAGGKPRVQA